MSTQTVYSVYTDGGSRGNPGPAAYGFVIYGPDGGLLEEGSRYIGETTNNQAEYQGIVAALESLQHIHLAAPVVCHLDSQLVVRQINGQYRMKNADLQPWLQKIHTLKGQLPVTVTFIDIPREMNRYADKLVNKALDERMNSAHE